MIRKRRPRPSYKKLYEALQASIAKQEGYEKFTDSIATHIVTVYDTVEWRYHIKANSDEEAERFDPLEENCELVGMEKTSYFDRSECHPV